MNDPSYPKRLDQYVEYIRNTGHNPMPTSMFDEDWEPIGQMVRRELAHWGLIIPMEGDRLALPPPGEGER